VENQSLAYSVCRRFLEEKNLLFSEQSFRNVLATKNWPGRLHKISDQPAVFFDVSHNISGIKGTLEFVRSVIPKEKLNVLVGLVEDKDFQSIAQAISEHASGITITEPDTHRKLNTDKLAGAFNKAEKSVKIIKDPHKAYEFSISQLKKEDFLLVTGSHYLIGSLLEKAN
jgi:dihydrofolate synthase/folylpolyglutamate synthase